MAFNLDDFVVEQPRGLLTQSHPDDQNEESDVEMNNEFVFDDIDKDENDNNTHINKHSNDDESNKNNNHNNNNNSTQINNKTLLDLARENTDLSFITSIEDKILKWKSKYKLRIAKTYKKNPQLRQEDEKWFKNIKNMQKKNKNKNLHAQKNDTSFREILECGDQSSDFSLLGISRIILSIIRKDLKWNYPTPVQRETIPLALKGYDLLINAITGSGKSGAFIIPIIQRLILSPQSQETNDNTAISGRILIVTPTRELAIQISEIFGIFTTKFKLKCQVIIGGVSCDKQYQKLMGVHNGTGCDIIIATPGRIIDLIHNYNDKILSFIEILVLDEADKLLSMGFQAELYEIFAHLPGKQDRQNILCSATLSDSVLSLAKLSLNNEHLKRISIDESLALNNKFLTQEFIRLHIGQEKYRKAMLLALLLGSFYHLKCIIFCRTKKETHLMRIICEFFDIKCIELHGDLSQYDRLKALQLFKQSENKNGLKLICTDIASRGIDICDIDLVLNMEFPTNIKTYIHRVGRTARAGHRGYSCTFVSDKRKKLLKKLLKTSGNNKNIKSRTLNNEFVLWCLNKINDIKNETIPLLKSENKEREMRLLNIKLKRSTNLLNFESEIFSRQKRKWIMGDNEKRKIKKEAQRNDLGAIETRKLEKKDNFEKMQRKKDLEWSKIQWKKAVSMKKKMNKKLRIENKTKTGNQLIDTLDMIKNPFKYNKNVKKNIQIKMKKMRNYKKNNNQNKMSQFKSSSSSVMKNKFNNKKLRKKIRAKGNKRRFKNRRK